VAGVFTSEVDKKVKLKWKVASKLGGGFRREDSSCSISLMGEKTTNRGGGEKRLCTEGRPLS